MSKPILEITEGSTENTLSLEDNKQFVIPRLVNIIKTYDNYNNEIVTKNYYPLIRCSKEFFSKSEYEEEYFHHAG